MFAGLFIGCIFGDGNTFTGDRLDALFDNKFGDAFNTVFVGIFKHKFASKPFRILDCKFVGAMLYRLVGVVVGVIVRTAPGDFCSTNLSFVWRGSHGEISNLRLLSRIIF